MIFPDSNKVILARGGWEQVLLKVSQAIGSKPFTFFFRQLSERGENDTGTNNWCSSLTVEFRQDDRTSICKKLPEDTLTNASIDISFFGRPSAISGQLLRGHAHSLNVNHSVLKVSLPEGRQERCGKVLTLQLVEYLAENLLIRLQYLDPLGHSP